MNSVDFLLWLEGLRNPAFTAVFAVATFLGSPEFALILMPLIYWCVNRTLGVRLAWVLLGSTFANEALKAIVMEPRPGPPLNPIFTETGGGSAWPSGHAMNAAALWLTLSGMVRGRRLLIPALILTFLIGFSRLYFSLHWPIDVVSGWILGALIAAVGLALYRAYPNLRAQDISAPLLAGLLLIPVLLIILLPTGNAAVATGAGMGIIPGWWLERRYVGFEAPAPLQQQIIKLLIGLAGVLALRYGLKPVLGVIPGEAYADFIRYAIIGLWVACGAPAIFVRLFGRQTATVSEPARG